jgi:hypothetical protein
MPAQSQQQQKLFGLALSVKRGETPRSEASDDVINIVDTMSEKEIEDFASTSHSGIPTKVETQLRGVVREIMRERVLSEGAGKEAMGIAAFTGTRGDAVQKFIDDNKLDAKKLFNYVKAGKLKERMDFVTALVGNPGNKIQKMIISKFGIKESVNEGVSSADMGKIKGAVEAAKSFMSVGAELKKLGMKYTFATEPLPIYIIQPTPNNRVAVVNKKYASKPDFVVGDIAVGIMEGNSVNEIKKLPNGNFSIKKGYNTFADYEKNAKIGDTILKYDKRGGMIKTFVNGSELHQNAKKYLSKVHSIVGDKVNLSLFGKQGYATVPDYEKKEVGVLVLESINEASYNFGKVQYTKKNMTPTDILSLAYAYAETPTTKIIGNKHEYRVNAANDLAKLTGSVQLDAKTKGKEPALILFLLKNSLVTKDEYIKLFKALKEKQISVIKALKNSSPEMRGSGGAARAAAKDMRGEFDID